MQACDLCGDLYGDLCGDLLGLGWRDSLFKGKDRKRVYYGNKVLYQS